jgi:glutathione S-transferase
VIAQDEATQITQQLLQVLESRLQHHDWLATHSITIADIAIYPYIALAHEGQVSLEAYPAIQHWLARIEALDGYIGMVGMR